jgi:hypothetical protein
MKKFLLLLSCFLATWCSVQAANPQITSATYNESTSQFYVNCTSGNNLYIDVICMKTGPVLSKVNINTYKTIDLPITSRPGEYDLVLYTNGTPCHDKKVTVTQYGHINNITNISTSSVTVNYSMFHAETDNYPKNSYLKIGDAKYYIKNVKNGSLKWTGLNLPTGKNTCKIYVDGVCKHTIDFIVTPPPTPYGHINNVYDISKSSVTVNYTVKNAKTSNCYLKIGNYKHNITNGVNVIYKWTGLNLPAGKNTCEIYVDGVRKHTYDFTVTPPSAGIKITPMGGDRLKFDFSISNTGVDVAFRVTVASLTNYAGETITYPYGVCDQYQGTYEVTVPHYTGQVIYAVELLVNGSSVNGASIQVYK